MRIPGAGNTSRYKFTAGSSLYHGTKFSKVLDTKFSTHILPRYRGGPPEGGICVVELLYLCQLLSLGPDFSRRL